MPTSGVHRGRHGFKVWGVAILVCAAAVLATASTAAAKVSDADCQVLLGGEFNPDRGNPGQSEQANLAEQASAFESGADQVSDKKLKKGLLLLAGVYEDASKQKNLAAAGRALASNGYAKGFKAYSKALNQCLMSSVPKP